MQYILPALWWFLMETYHRLSARSLTNAGAALCIASLLTIGALDKLGYGPYAFLIAMASGFVPALTLCVLAICKQDEEDRKNAIMLEMKMLETSLLVACYAIQRERVIDHAVLDAAFQSGRNSQ